MKIGMKKYRLIRLLNSLNKAEHVSFSQFLDSPYHNKRADIKALYQELQFYVNKEKPFTREELWQKVFPEKTYDDQQLRLIMSYLSKLFEQFVTVEDSLSNAFKGKMSLVRYLGERSLYQLQERCLKDAKKALEKQPFRQAEYFFHSYEYHTELERLSSTYRPDKSPDFAALEQAFEQAVLAIKMRQEALSLNLQKVYKREKKSGKLDELINTLTIDDIKDQVAVLIYWHAVQFLGDPKKDQHFQVFKTLLFENSHIFPHNEARELYLLAINFVVHKLNQGQKTFFNDIMDLYKAGLQHTYLLTNGVLSRFTYYNIVSAAIQVGETKWAKAFLEEWTPKLEKRFRERMYNFNRAKIAYATQQYDEALSLLQQSNYHDLLLNLRARTLLLKIYFEQEKWDALNSHLDAFNSYLRRKSGLSYHRTNYQNLIRFTKKILSANLHDKVKIEALQKEIKKDALLTEKDWLLGVLGSAL